MEEKKVTGEKITKPSPKKTCTFFARFEFKKKT